MVDIHSHILPGIDDGSKSVEESIRMLEASAAQGVSLIVATPHFYANDDSPEKFLRRREAAVKRLREAWQAASPTLLPGAEVCYFDGVSRVDAMRELQIGTTGLLLLEMPFAPWSRRTVAEVRELQNRPDTEVVLAHIERYLRFQKAHVWQELRSCGVRMQCNAEFFLHWRTRRKALRMLRRGEIQFVGSDCHNMSGRPPNLGPAMQVIDQKTGGRGRAILEREAAAIFGLREA